MFVTQANGRADLYPQPATRNHTNFLWTHPPFPSCACYSRGLRSLLASACTALARLSYDGIVARQRQCSC
eukprot:3896179-Pleurochrysis_carterae.AAC.1